MTAAQGHVADLVQRQDRDCFLASLYVPEARRPHVFTVHAFALEIGRIPGLVSEPHLGLIRLQWWRETLEGLARGEVQGHPLASELAGAIAAARLPLAAFHGMIEATERELDRRPLADLDALEAHLGATSGARIQLVSLVLAGERAAASARAAGLAGVAWGLHQLIDAPARHVLLPEGLTVAEARNLARQRLAEARALRPTIDGAALPAFLPAGLGSHADSSPFRRQWLLWWRARHDRF
jgi:phytoene synthase